LAEIGIKLLFKSEFKVCRLDMWRTGLVLKTEEFVLISNPRCILGSVFENIKHSSQGVRCQWQNDPTSTLQN